MRHLLCGDEAQNNGNWQWITSIGVDPAPYFRRMYNPMTQQRRHDPDGEYVRRWCPELRDVPLERLAEPWTMSRRRSRRRPAASSAATTRRRSSTTSASASGRWSATARSRAASVCGRAVRARALRPARPAARRPAAAPDRRAHAARRAGGELLVPPPPRRLRVDRRAGGRAAGRRPGLRRGLRLGGARRARRPPSSGWTPTPRRSSTRG